MIIVTVREKESDDVVQSLDAYNKWEGSALVRKLYKVINHDDFYVHTQGDY